MIEPVVHLVPQGSSTLTAACGRALDGYRHTGHFPGGVIFAERHGEPHCPACLRMDGEPS